LGGLRSQELLLDIRCEVQQVHDLGQPGSAHAAQPRQLRLIRHNIVTEELIEPDRERHQPCDSWDAARRRRGHFTLTDVPAIPESIALVQEIYDAGAVEVLAVEIDDYPDDGQNTGKLVIRLPNGEQRKGVFAWAGSAAEAQGFDPEQDMGQSYLFVMLD
jgi:hypothetical protein